jgi:hypothetical protein
MVGPSLLPPGLLNHDVPDLAHVLGDGHQDGCKLGLLPLGYLNRAGSRGPERRVGGVARAPCRPERWCWLRGAFGLGGRETGPFEEVARTRGTGPKVTPLVGPLLLNGYLACLSTTLAERSSRSGSRLGVHRLRWLFKNGGKCPSLFHPSSINSNEFSMKFQAASEFG